MEGEEGGDLNLWILVSDEDLEVLVLMEEEEGEHQEVLVGQVAQDLVD